MADSTYGQGGAVDYNSPFNSTAFQIREALGSVRTSVPVKIIAVNGGGHAAAPTVDVQPLVNQMDGIGDKTDHGIIYGIPVQRSQGGGNAIINDPKVGDVGVMSIADRDISALKGNEGGQSNPGSFRRHSMSDGVYIGAILNPAVPTQSVQFTDQGVKIFGAGGGVMEIIGADIFFTGTLHVTGDVIAGDGAVSLLNHIHSDVVPGGGTSGPPVPEA